MKRINVLVVGAHPDDIEIGCAGTISKHLSLGDKVYAMVMTNGEKGNHSPGKRECLKSLEVLGIKDNVIFGNFDDGFLRDDHKTVSFIEKYINELNITRVYTHSPNDRHQDHRHCSFAVSSAARKRPEILLFQGPSTTNFEPHYFIEISKKDLEKKLAAIKCYETQIRKGTVKPELIKSIAMIHGSTCNKKYAEAFAINHLFREGLYV
ncbi:MAG: PIG-L deacetylase family protein [Candidatus Nanoarchaeia archaeon]